MPKDFVPQIATSNDLLDGHVIYFTAAGDWSPRHEDAAVAHERPAAEALLAAANAHADRISGAYLADAALDPQGRPLPVHYREVIRTRGPSVRPDLGKQADL